MYLEMLCKESIVTWFKDLTSFKRIDVMCNLLQSCQPFETRFLGTCIEELGRKDFALLRQLENIVNNPAELSTQDLNNMSDKEVRSKLSKFLCVLHSTNKRCANELYNILMNLYEDVNNIIKSGALLNDDSPLDEILLIYALGIFHPAFSFDKKIYLGDLVSRLMQEEERIHLFKQKEMMSPDNYSSDNIAMSQVPEPLPNPGPEEPMLSMPVLSYPPVLPTVMSHTSSPSGSPPIRSKPPITPVDHKPVSPNPVPEPLPNPGPEEPMLSMPVLSYPPVLPTVMSHTSSPSGSPPIRSKPPITPVDHKPVSPNPLRLPVTETDIPGLGIPPGVKESRLITNGKPTEELWLQSNMRRQAYVMPVFYPSPTPTTPSPSTCTSSCLHNGGTPTLPTRGPPTSPPNSGPAGGDQMRDLRLGDQMRDLRLGEIPLPGEGGQYSPANSSSDSNISEHSPPPTPHEMGRGLPPSSSSSSQQYSKSSRGSSLSLGGAGSTHQYR
ncbi:SH3 domain-containing protein C23A1.17 [Diaphorina citri]|uniref:SH3 domain-containing protein C23A1.17 n=1 Tax=Diaphorina citri TaxID=121845 RepID=A0A1S3D4U6_DIACI|nr:SH3 domain-containing protein C23A1.17 [Diaphorina citri]